MRTVEVQADNNFPASSLFTAPQLSKNTVKNVISLAIKSNLEMSESNGELTCCCAYFLLFVFLPFFIFGITAEGYRN